MIPNKCKCNWIPTVYHIKDPMWGNTIYVQVICENCHRRGKKMPTRTEAIEEWNTNGPDEAGVMSDNINPTDCNACKYLKITEEEQNFIKQRGNTFVPHWCLKYNKRVFHKPYHEPMIHPCDECIKEKENNNE